MSEPVSILFCNCSHSDIIKSGVKSAVLEALQQRGIVFKGLNGLCRAAKERQPFLKEFAQHGGLVIACYPRAVKWLFHWSGNPLDEDKVTILNMRTQNPELIISELDKLLTAKGEPVIDKFVGEDNWIPWFPVIDKDRCSNCKQCMNFCLFSVYKQSQEGRVIVENPANCKTNCPACAKMCPQQAIIFPKYEHSPINGDEVMSENEGDTKQDPANIDINKMLRNRQKGGVDAYKEIAKKLDIPSDVLDSMGPLDVDRVNDLIED